MQDDQLAFAAEVTAIAQALGFTPDDLAPLERAQKITSCVQQARDARTMRATRLGSWMRRTSGSAN